MKLPLTAEDCDLLDADNIHTGNTWEEGDAARIVAAVNHADALAEALRTVLPYVGTDAPFPRRVLDQAEAVLAAYAAAKEAQP